MNPDKLFRDPAFLARTSTTVHDARCVCIDQDYRKTSSISRTKFQNLNGFRLVLQLSLLNALEPGVKSRMKM